MNPFIQNIALMDVSPGHHRGVGGNGVLIQIIDSDRENFPLPLNPSEWVAIHKFRFMDVEEDVPVSCESHRISDSQAEELAAILRSAYAQRRNVIVHCHAGLCRSGAIVEAGVRIGFEDTKRFRQPNRMVLNKILKYLPEGQFRPFGIELEEKVTPPELVLREKIRELTGTAPPLMICKKAAHECPDDINRQILLALPGSDGRYHGTI